MPAHDSLHTRIDAALREFLHGAGAHLRDLDPELAPLAASASEFVLRGGKRLRPQFCFWGYRAAGGGDDPAVVTAAASLELVQAGALVHDDVIDASDTRRGNPSMHREWEGRHRVAGWTGDPQQFGVAAAILVGDLFLVWSDQMLRGSGLPPGTLARIRPVWDQMRAEVMAGQVLDVLGQAQGRSSVERALRVAELKSGRYSVERPLHLGAALANAGPAVRATLSRFGVAVGVAFQLRDDLLGVLGDPADTGKPAGDDIREGKRTVLIATAYETASAQQRRILDEALGRRSLSAVDVASVREVLHETGAIHRVEQMIDHRARLALGALDDPALDPAGAQKLRDLVAAALHRTG